MNKSNILRELSEFIEIQSVSSQPQKSSEMTKAVSFLTRKLENLGFRITLDGSPSLIIATRDSGSKKTIGIYGHYDVQPEDPIAEWHSDPFTLTQKEGKLLGRGIADDKGHIIQNIAAIEMLISSGKLTNNIVFVLEGEEETGSEQLEKQLQTKSDVLKNVDVFYITDSGMHAKNIPMIEYALRGLVYFEITVTTGERDLHSGVYGNTAYNPANILSGLLGSMKDISTGKILIPGFYDDIKKQSNEEMTLLNTSIQSEEELIKEMSAYTLTTVEGTHPSLASKIHPSMDIHGMESGFRGEGPKTVIPRTARAKFSFRLVEDQNPAKIERLVKEYIATKIPEGVHYTIEVYAKDTPFYTSLENSFIQHTGTIMSTHFGNNTVFSRSGGSIPVAEMIQRILDKPVIITGFTLPDDNIHAPNENFDEDMFWEGIECLQKIYGQV